MKKRTRGNPIPLIVEDHPADYNGYPFITLILYRDEHFLTIIDNADDKHVKAFVLDLCGPEHIREDVVVDIAAEWWKDRKDRFPISFEFSRLGLTDRLSAIYRTFNIEYIKRVIGPLQKFEMSEVTSVKRRKRKALSKGIEIHSNVHQLRSSS